MAIDMLGTWPWSAVIDEPRNRAMVCSVLLRQHDTW